MHQEQNFGSVVVLSGPSGVGKSTVCSLLRTKFAEDGLHFSVSCTTRAKRAGEIDGMSYHFIDEVTYNKHLENGSFIEHAEVHGFLYGTLKSELKHIKEGKEVIFDIDVQGMRQLKKNLADDEIYGPRIITVFMMPPSIKDLEKRQRGRRTDAEDVIQRRLKNAKAEIAAWREYDYLLINEESEETSILLSDIIRGSHFRSSLITQETWEK